jgi:hypothetical protein
MLEYQNSVVFLTTNRILHFDPAVLSRVTISIAFDDLSEGERARVWCVCVRVCVCVQQFVYTYIRMYACIHTQHTRAHTLTHGQLQRRGRSFCKNTFYKDTFYENKFYNDTFYKNTFYEIL